MNRWVLLEHKILINNVVDIHYDFLLEDQLDCLTWKLDKVPLINKGFVAIHKQPNHRRVWLSRVQCELSDNRGIVKRSDHGPFGNISRKSDLRICNTFITSGSPNLALYSITFIPFLVRINPPYKIPL